MQLKAATHACAAELTDRAIPFRVAVAAVTDLVVECWKEGLVPTPAPLVREALLDVVDSWCASELDRIASAEQPATRYSPLAEGLTRGL